MPRAASLPGAELFLRNRTFFKQATCPGQLRCLGQNFSSETEHFFLTNHLSRAASLLEAELVLRNRTFFKQATLRCLGQNFFSEIELFLNKPLVPGSFAAWGRTFSQKSDFFSTSHLSRAASLPGADFLLRNLTFFCNKPLVLGSFAAWGRFVLRNRTFF